MKKLIYSYNSYSSQCDNINKYILNSLYTLPSIKSITLDIPLLQLLDVTNKTKTSKYVALNSYSKCYYIFYLAFLFFPYINFKESKKTSTKNYALKFMISTKKKVDEFLYNFFIYLISNVNPFSTLLHNKIDKKEINFIKNKIIIKNINYKIPMFYLYDLNPYFNQFFFEINLKNLNFYINLKYTSYTLKTYSSLKNTVLFWI